jgi:hypothetical protein
MRSYVQLSGAIFALVALGHLVRLFFRWPLVMGHHPIPFLISFLVFAISAAMAAWAWRVLGSSREQP